MKAQHNRHTGVLFLLALAWADPGIGQEAHPFDGITLMLIQQEKIHEAVGINPGFRGGQPSMLMIVVAGGRSYASVTKGYDRQPSCMTWIRPESLQGEAVRNPSPRITRFISDDTPVKGIR